jgi:16S rRNA (uracil1498-N3)-methyltransferase
MIHQPQPEITGPQAGHICRVLRLGAGEAVELFDGTGAGYLARIVSASPRCVRLSIDNSFPLLTESHTRITVAQGILKDRKMDEVVRQLTELGIDRWMPFYADRSVPVPGNKPWAGRLDRWEKIALEAVKQCRRGRIPGVVPADNFKAVLAASATVDLKIVFWEETPQAFQIPGPLAKTPESVLVAIGPEGGFSAEEIRQAKRHGFFTAGLGPRLLRAPTAALAACTLVQYAFGDMGGR